MLRDIRTYETPKHTLFHEHIVAIPAPLVAEVISRVEKREERQVVDTGDGEGRRNEMR